MIEIEIDIKLTCDKCGKEENGSPIKDIEADIKDEINDLIVLNDWEQGKMLLCEECQLKYDELRS